MRIAVDLIVLFVSVCTAYRLGKMEMARFVWSLLSNRRTDGMVQAVCLYCAMTNPRIMHKNKWKNVDDVCSALQSNRELVDTV